METRNTSGLVGRILAGLAVAGGLAVGVAGLGSVSGGCKSEPAKFERVSSTVKEEYGNSIVKEGYGLGVFVYDKDGIKKAQIINSQGEVVYDFGEKDKFFCNFEATDVAYSTILDYNKIDKNEKYILYIEDVAGNVVKITEKVEIKEKGIDDVRFERYVWTNGEANFLSIEISDSDGIRRAYLRDREGNIVYDIVKGNCELDGEGKYRVIEYFDRELAKSKGLDVDEEYSLYVEDNKGDKETRRINNNRMRTLGEIIKDSIRSFNY